MKKQDDVLAQYAATPSALKTPKSAELREITQLARKQLRLMAKVAKAEVALKTAQEQLDVVQSHDLPNAMTAVGMHEFTLKDGTKVKISDVVRAAIPADPETRKQAIAWLVANKQDGLIKSELDVLFAKGDRRITKLVELLRKQKQFKGLEFQQLESVHPSTLSAWVRQQYDAGKTVREDLLGVYRTIKAVITPKKVKTNDAF